MSFHITIKSCTPSDPKTKAKDLFCVIKIGQNKFQTPAFEQKARTAVWNYSFATDVKESFLKIELWSQNFLVDKKLGDAIINLSKFYSTPGLPHTQVIAITKDFIQVAEVFIDVQYSREAQSQPVQAKTALRTIPKPYNTPNQQAPLSIHSSPNLAPKKLYDTPVPYSNVSNISAESTSNYKSQAKPEYQVKYPEPAHGSFLNPEAYQSNKPAQASNLAQQSGQNTYMGNRATQNPATEKYVQQTTTYNYPPTVVAYVTQYPDSGAPLIEPSVLVKQVMGQGMDVQPMYDQKALRQMFADQYYRPLGWL